MPRKPATPKPKPIFSRPDIVGLCKRFLKDGMYDPVKSPVLMYQIVKLYPNESFWREYKLDWKPDSLSYFLSKHGRERLDRDWATFSLDIPPQAEYKLEDAKVGPDAEIVKRPKTVAELLR